MTTGLKPLAVSLALLLATAAGQVQARTISPDDSQELAALGRCAFVFGMYEELDASLVADLKPRIVAAEPRLEYRLDSLFESVGPEGETATRAELEALKTRITDVPGSGRDFEVNTAAEFRPDMLACLDRADALPDPPARTQ